VPAAPISPRFDARAFWTGSEMVVFGGVSVDEGPLADGAAWNPGSNAWRPIAVPPGGIRDAAVVAWAGDRLVVWGGADVLPADAPDDAEPQFHNDGAAWVARDNTWVAVPPAPIQARSGAESVWTGSRLILSGGYSLGEGDERRDGAAFDPVSGGWTPIAARPAPGSCGGETPCAGVWTGSVALFPGAGLAYDPAGNRWSEIAPFPAADGRVTTDHSMVWTGRQLLVWGAPTEAPDADTGAGVEGPEDGFSYDPAGNGWQRFAAGPLGRRGYHTAVWTGQEMLVWGGTDGDAVLADGAAYRPAG
jgi:N-acetylneuraminic acid mutarotase